MSDRIEIVTFDDEEGFRRFPGELMADANVRDAIRWCGMRVYRGTHEFEGRRVVAFSMKRKEGHILRTLAFQSHEALVDWLSGARATGKSESLNDALNSLAIQALTQIGGGVN